jgi:threonine/homoserine efflux transporter RhtA
VGRPAGAIAGLAGLLLLGQHLESTELLGMGLVMAASAGAITAVSARDEPT